ncbi:hypothetical protein FJQ98_16555 [Lysinibacillus agricola]|uniref:Uncharacterized protein n=1 Tax=Lysinibacillus agricola TaxID=2590012 RepID=A0ABX7ALS2_9BACI|nr:MULTISPECIES: hypothetical protein [Lysinibacillus]KOS61461.1 hypothetical protein AN161_17880 [Lysinibacillus sp. FJAT-14222]QQP10857.1 hypothetical protein FJQ98_16555 [Lysinibacillus agricola]
MKIKNILLSVVTAFTLFTGAATNNDTLAKEIKETSNKYTHVQTNNLKDNQTELFYIYSNEIGHYFLDPKAEFENVIYVGINDYKIDENFKIDTTSIHRGKKFIGTFVDDSLWELTGLEAVDE